MPLFMILSFIIAAAIGPAVINKTKDLGLRQTEKNVGAVTHSEKEGTPMMGGFIFLIPIFGVSILYIIINKSFIFEFLFLLISTFAFALVGYLDDSIKANKGRNLGLNETQKLILQFIIAILMTVIWYLKRGGNIIIPFSNNEVDLKLFFLPLIILVIAGTVNSVNLLDGMDGLATSVTLIYLIFYVALGFICKLEYVSTFSLIIIGGLAGFLIYNHHPAKIFMGDTGAMALGGIVAGLATVTETSLYIPIVGFIFFMEALSVMIQVFWYKRTKKRVFLMAPIHYHFEKKGLKETQVVLLFACIQLALTIFGIWSLR